PLIGAVVRVIGTTDAAITDLDGNFTISNVTSGDYSVEVSSVGYLSQSFTTSISDNTVDLGTISLAVESVAIQGIEIIADVAVDRKTPVAVSNISGEYIAEKTGNQELTMALSVAPSVYASQDSGGFGDSRLVVRGFQDENVVIMVNGVPVNDMENQALFWSNWTGLQDVASKVQIQRGLGATLLAVPSVGGTVNIISKATDAEKGGWASASIGNDMWRKYAVQLNTGASENGWAVSFAGSRTTGDGYVDGNFIDAYSWFGSITKDWDKHSLALTGFGAPQRHGQGFFRPLNTFVGSNGDDYADFIGDSKAHDFDAKAALIDGTTGTANSIRYNSGWGYTDYDVNNGFTQDGIFNQFSNFYHKPQVSLAHFWNVNDGLDVTTSVYGSWGRGGGASDWRNFSNSGSHRWFNYQESNATGSGGPIAWDDLLANNIAFNPDGVARQGSANNPFYFFRASMNHHNYYGIISKALVDLSDELKLTAGIDGRTYAADHIRKVIDMFGLQGYEHSDFGPTQISPADGNVFGYDSESLFNRDNTGFVNWIGAFSELEYSNDRLTAALALTGSNKGYKKDQRVASVAGESDWFNFLGGAVKGGLNYNVSDAFNVYANGGYLSIQPIFDNVFQGGNNGGVDESFVFDDAANEKVLAFEAGAGLRFSKFAANLNVYRTSWEDKAISVSGQDPTTLETIFGNAFGVDALHQGVELDLIAQPATNFEITGSASVGDWEWQNNSEFQLFNIDGTLNSSGGFFLEDVKVGGAPQTQYNIGGNYRTPFGVGLYAGYQHNAEHYALFDPEDRDDASSAGVDPNKLPDFGLTNAGVSYNLKLTENQDLRFDFNVNNLMDVLYVNRAFENLGAPLQDLRGNFGLGRTWNAGARLEFRDGAKKVEEIPVPVAEPEPVVLDRDGDGVIDAADDCPDTPGTVSGCPDGDGDGVIDANDECPNTPGLASNSGCPAEPEVEETVVEVPADIPDADGDGLLDNVDNCPNEAGPASNAGCPVRTVAPAAPSTTVVDQINFIAKSILFNTNSDVIRTVSRTKLDEIAAIMQQYPNTRFVVEGHTDSSGDDSYNMDLSRKRAAAVVNYLVGKGINRSMLSSVGYGETQPIASNSTAEGRAQNRRVVVRLGN
ncbi:MAG: OmpA family protein, partial [Saprospiraceae bacterium]|nr:OmpA family protein [Saprospiraceae bacterium]